MERFKDGASGGERVETAEFFSRKISVVLNRYDMSIPPSLNARKIIRVLKKAGFVEERQKGSHLILVHPQTRARTVVPIHGGKTIKKSLVYAIIHDARLTVEEFMELL